MNGSSSGPTTFNITLSQTVAAGNAIAIAYMGANNSFSGTFSLTSVVDDKSNSYPITPAPYKPIAVYGGSGILGSLCTGNITNGPSVFTFTIASAGGGSSPTMDATVYEVSGLGSNPLLDVSGEGGQFYNPVSGSETTNSFTTAFPNELALVSGYFSAGTAVFTQNNGWTQAYQETTYHALMLYNVLSASGSNSLQMTPSVSTLSYLQIQTWTPNAATVAPPIGQAWIG